MAIPTTLLILVIGMAFATVAVIASVASQQGSVRDQDRKTGIAAADAGVDEALLRQNNVPVSPSAPCLGVTSENLLVEIGTESDGWCPAVSGSVGSATYTYRTSPRVVVPAESSPTGQDLLQMNVSSTGTSDQESRRVLIRASAPSGGNIFGADRAVGVDGVRIGGTSSVDTSTGSDGDVTVEDNGTLCGNARHGPGHQVIFNNNGEQCVGYSQTEGVVPFPPPDLSHVYASNDNWRMFTLDTATGAVSWDPNTRTLRMQGNASVTLGGNNYLFCRLDMSGSSRLIMARGSNVRIYFDSPENCGMSSPAEQIKVIGTSAIVSTAFNPSVDNYSLPGLYMLGSDTVQTTAYFDGTAQVLNEFVLYAPRTDITITGTSTYVGALAGKTLLVDGTATVTSDANMPAPDVNVVIVYVRDRYVECTGGSASPPDQSC